jgi:ribosome maturation factor RimP
VDIEAVKLKIEGWLEEKFAQQPEFFLVDVKMQGRKISVFLDGDNGIPIDKCAEFSRYLERHLEGEMLVDANYILEVSSPGMDNPLKTKRQYKNAVGREVSIVKFDGIRLDGVLKDADETRLVLEIAVKEKGNPETSKTEEILLTDIKSTKLQINI